MIERAKKHRKILLGYQYFFKRTNTNIPECTRKNFHKFMQKCRDFMKIGGRSIALC